MKKTMWAALGLSLASSAAVNAETSSVTVTLGEPPFIYNTVDENVLAPIVIREKFRNALRDGYISLCGIANVDNNLYFTPATIVSGAVANYRFDFSLGSCSYTLVIEVDADDSKMDSIVINPVADVRFDVYMDLRFTPVNLRLLDGHPVLGDGTPAGTPAGIGDAEGPKTVGIFAGNGGIEIGSSTTLDLKPHQTVTLPLNEGVPSHPAFVLVESLDPSVVSVDGNTLTEVTLTAHRPGMTRVQAWDPSGNSGYVYVSVPKARPGPKNPRGPKPLPTDGIPSTLAGPRVLSLDDEQGTKFFPEERVKIDGAIVDRVDKLSASEDFFLVVKYTTPQAQTSWLQKNADGQFIPWAGDLESLQPLSEAVALEGLHGLEAYEGRLLPGRYELYFGYWLEDGYLVYNQDPIEFSVGSGG